MGDGALTENPIASRFVSWADRKGFERFCMPGGSGPSEDAKVRFLLMEESLLFGVGELNGVCIRTYALFRHFSVRDEVMLNRIWLASMI